MRKEIYRKNIIINKLILLLLCLSQNNIQAQSCIEQTTYGTGSGCFNDCSNLAYNGQNGLITIPLKFHKSIINTSADFDKIVTLVNSANQIFANNEVKIKFVAIDQNSSLLSFNTSYCAYNTANGTDCDCSTYNGSKYASTLAIAQQNPAVINIIVFEHIYLEKKDATGTCDANDYEDVEGNAFYPNVESGGANNYLVLRNDVLNNTKGHVLAHELGHIMGLYHTFENGPFGTNACGGNDGISETPENDTDSNLPSSQTGNLMDYNNSNINLTIAPCQKAKIYDILFTCRNNLCSNPSPPVIQLSSGTNVTNLTYNFNANLDILYPKLNPTSGTNTGNFAQFKLKNLSGLTLQTWYANSLNLDDVFSTTTHPKSGSYFLEVRDSSIYSDCISLPNIISINFQTFTSNGNCFDIVYADYSYECGAQRLYETTGVMYRYGGRVCNDGTTPVTTTTTSTGGGTNGGGTGPGTGPGGPGGPGIGTVGTGTNVPVITKNEECNECAKEIIRKTLLIKVNGEN